MPPPRPLSPLSRMDTMHPSRGQVQSAQSTIAPVIGSPLPVLTENFTIGLGRVNTIGGFANSIGCTSGSSEVLGWGEPSLVAFLAEGGSLVDDDFSVELSAALFRRLFSACRFLFAFLLAFSSLVRGDSG